MKQNTQQPTTRRYFSCFFAEEETITQQNITKNVKEKAYNRGNN